MSKPGSSNHSRPLHEADFLRLFVSNEEALRAYARLMLPDWESVDDVIQEASVVMWRKLTQLRSHDGFLPWAKVIVRFEALKFRRARGRDRHVFDDALVEVLTDEREAQEEPDAERVRKALQFCLSKLGHAQRELVLLPYRDHGAVDRLAKRRECSANSLYKKIGRLREKLQCCVEGQLSRS